MVATHDSIGAANDSALQVKQSGIVNSDVTGERARK
jgi:hypothetical protein